MSMVVVVVMMMIMVVLVLVASRRIGAMASTHRSVNNLPGAPSYQVNCMLDDASGK
jgi:hypothetical protein